MSETKDQAATQAQMRALPASTGAKGIVELKVTAHLMSFDAGIYCIFNPPGSPVPDPATGLPGVRVSVPPGPAFHPEAVTISTFRDDGWLGGWNGAALVRVARGPAQILVTIYQLTNHAGEAPKLQIMRLTEGAPGQARPASLPVPPAVQPAAAAIQPVPQNTPAGASGGTPAEAADAEITAHVQTRGDVVTRLGDWIGTVGSKNWIEGFALAPRHAVGPGDIEYQAVLGRGWLSPWAEGGQFCGSRGMSLPILGLRVRLKGEAADNFDCAVAATFVDGTQVGPLDNGDPCQAESLAPLEAFRIELRPRSEQTRAKTLAPAAKSAKPPAKPAPKAPAKRK